jgi:glycosyltransferase involved in cell wall biosynthesis
LGLRLDYHDKHPQVWFINTVEDERILAELYKAADVTILISGGEGFGLPQLEAHACGKPCIVGNYSASSELIVDKRESVEPQNWYWEGVNQCRRPIYDYRGIAGRLIFAAEHPLWREEVGQAGLAQARERTWDKILPKWIELFRLSGKEVKVNAEAEIGSLEELATATSKDTGTGIDEATPAGSELQTAGREG